MLFVHPIMMEGSHPFLNELIALLSLVHDRLTIDNRTHELVSSSSIPDPANAEPVVDAPRMWRLTRATPNSFSTVKSLSNTPSSAEGGVPSSPTPPLNDDASDMHDAQLASVPISLSLSTRAKRRVPSTKSSKAKQQSGHEQQRIQQNTLSSSQRIRPRSSNAPSTSLTQVTSKRPSSARPPIRTWQKRHDGNINSQQHIHGWVIANLLMGQLILPLIEPSNAEVDINREAPIHIHSVHVKRPTSIPLSKR
jgi:hypothetical protein